MCPKTGQPDFGGMSITYAPSKLCVELKSLKFYLQQYRNQGIFYEALTNRMLDDLVSACSPRWMDGREPVAAARGHYHQGKRPV